MKKDQPGLLFEDLNNHHPNIKLTLETMPQKFLEPKNIYGNNQIKTKVHRNEKKPSCSPDIKDSKTIQAECHQY